MEIETGLLGMHYVGVLSSDSLVNRNKEQQYLDCRMYLCIHPLHIERVYQRFAFSHARVDHTGISHTGNDAARPDLVPAPGGGTRHHPHKL